MRMYSNGSEEADIHKIAIQMKRCEWHVAQETKVESSLNVWCYTTGNMNNNNPNISFVTNSQK